MKVPIVRVVLRIEQHDVESHHGDEPGAHACPHPEEEARGRHVLESGEEHAEEGRWSGEPGERGRHVKGRRSVVVDEDIELRHVEDDGKERHRGAEGGEAIGRDEAEPARPRFARGGKATRRPGHGAPSARAGQPAGRQATGPTPRRRSHRGGRAR